MLTLRQKFHLHLNVALAYFIVYYFVINSCVNTFDFFKNYVFMGITYRHDDDFVSSFSYKTHQLVLIGMLALVSAQFTRPSLSIFQEVPLGLAIIHFFSVIVSISLFFNFLFELTSLAPETRLKVFRVELTKVFMTGVMFYLISLCFTTFMYYTALQVQETMAWKEQRNKHLRKKHEDKVNMYIRQGRLSKDQIPPFEADQVLTESEQLVEDFERYGIVKVNVSELFDYGLSKLDVAL